MRGISLALLLAATPALASQYPLDQASQIIPRADAKKFRRAGIRTTLDILLHGRTAADRQALASRTGFSIEKIQAWVLLTDLLRVRGIGPDVARLMSAVSIRTIADLQRADPTVAASAMRDFNSRSHFSPNPPGAESVSYWIVQARELPVVLE